MSFRVSEPEGDAIDRVRGDKSRGEFARRATLAAASRPADARVDTKVPPDEPVSTRVTIIEYDPET